MHWVGCCRMREAAGAPVHPHDAPAPSKRLSPETRGRSAGKSRGCALIHRPHRRRCHGPSDPQKPVLLEICSAKGRSLLTRVQSAPGNKCGVWEAESWSH